MKGQGYKMELFYDHKKQKKQSFDYILLFQVIFISHFNKSLSP